MFLGERLSSKCFIDFRFVASIATGNRYMAILHAYAVCL